MAVRAPPAPPNDRLELRALHRAKARPTSSMTARALPAHAPDPRAELQPRLQKVAMLVPLGAGMVRGSSNEGWRIFALSRNIVMCRTSGTGC